MIIDIHVEVDWYHNHPIQKLKYFQKKFEVALLSWNECQSLSVIFDSFSFLVDLTLLSLKILKCLNFIPTNFCLSRILCFPNSGKLLNDLLLILKRNYERKLDPFCSSAVISCRSQNLRFLHTLHAPCLPPTPLINEK